jgi:hypothetical protein
MNSSAATPPMLSAKSMEEQCLQIGVPAKILIKNPEEGRNPYERQASKKRDARLQPATERFPGA